MDANVEQVIAVATLTTGLHGQAQEAMNIYLVVISGYLLVAYFLGKQLTSFQTWLLTGLFLTFSVANTGSVYLFWEEAHYWGKTYGEGRAHGSAGDYIAVVLVLGILASLKFMWDARHPKSK